MGNSAPASGAGSGPERRDVSNTEICVTAKSSGVSGNSSMLHECFLAFYSDAEQDPFKANAACSVEKIRLITIIIKRIIYKR